MAVKRGDLVFLEKALSPNPELRELVFGYNDEYLKILDELLEELYIKGCKGIEVKIHETSPDLDRFQATISEMEFARFFLRIHMNVELLSNNLFKGRKALDIHVSSKSREYYVEVKNIQLDDETHVLGCKVAEYLNTLGLSFMVVVKASKSLSTPAYLHANREEKEKNCEKALKEFREKANDIHASSSIIEIETANADFELHPTNKNKSYLGISTMKEAICQPDDYSERIKYDILNKSQKREDWKDDELDKSYIVALDDKSWLFGIDTFNGDLFGHATIYLEPFPVPDVTVDSKIDHALKIGWKDYLIKMCILRNDRSIIPDNKRGMFLSEPVLANVTAIIVKNREMFYLLANPFAEERINNPAIIQELNNCVLGWE
jgi:hypothetical protein